MYDQIPPHVSLKENNAPRMKKPTRLLTNSTSLKELSKTCDRSHPHFACLGSVVVDSSRLSVAKCAG
eukprot:16244803-Heterocapsa_arctica.AAC.1